MPKYTVTTVCEATCRETWEVEITGDPSDNELKEALREQIYAGEATFIEDETTDEQDREIVFFREGSA